MAGANANFRFVNAMLNIGYLTGAIVITEERDRFYVRQTGNEQLDIPVFLPNLGYRMPPRNSIKTVVIHCYSHITDSGTSVKPVVVSVSDPSVLTMPPMSNFLLGFRNKISSEKLEHLMGEIKLPYHRDGSIKKEFLDLLKEENSQDEAISAIIEMYEMTRGSNRTGALDNNGNRVMIAGFVDRRSYVPPNEYQEHGHGRVDIRQHEERDKSLPIRLVGSQVRPQLERVKHPGVAIKVAGRLRRKIVPAPDGQGIISDVVYIETDLLQRANQGQDILSVPGWITTYRDEMLRRREAVAKQSPDTPPVEGGPTGGSDEALDNAG